MYAAIERECARLRDDVVGFAQELIRIPSPSLGEAALAERLEEAFLDLGYHLVTRDDYGNVLGVLLRDHHLPTLLLNSHMDTVAPAPDWAHAPYGGDIAGGRLYGLGAADCKGGLAAQLYAGHLLAGAPVPLRGNLVVAATVAEENGCSLGLRYLLERTLPELELRPTLAILGEPTALGLCHGHDGWAEVDVEVAGADHAGLTRAVDLVRRRLTEIDTGRYAPEVPLLSLRAPTPGDADGRQVTLRVVRRLHPGETATAFLAWVRRRVAGIPGADPLAVAVHPHVEEQRLYTGETAQVEFSTEAWSSDPFDPLVDRAREALQAAGCPALLRRWRLGRLGMGTGGSWLLRHRIPTIGFGPGDEAEAHAPDESLDLDALERAVYATAVLAQAFVGGVTAPRPLPC
jgi:acetylornithine deacetylase/succinyl-diaminopimelate desuccinylase-like protein